MSDSSDGARPVLRVVRGAPSDEELAALLAVMSVRARGADATARAAAPAPRAAGWADYWRGLRRDLPHGAGGWLASGRP